MYYLFENNTFFAARLKLDDSFTGYVYDTETKNWSAKGWNAKDKPQIYRDWADLLDNYPNVYPMKYYITLEGVRFFLGELTFDNMFMMYEAQQNRSWCTWSGSRIPDCVERFDEDFRRACTEVMGLRKLEGELRHRQDIKQSQSEPIETEPFFYSFEDGRFIPNSLVKHSQNSLYQYYPKSKIWTQGGLPIHHSLVYSSYRTWAESLDKLLDDYVQRHHYYGVYSMGGILGHFHTGKGMPNFPLLGKEVYMVDWAGVWYLVKTGKIVKSSNTPRSIRSLHDHFQMSLDTVCSIKRY